MSIYNRYYRWRLSTSHSNNSFIVQSNINLFADDVTLYTTVTTTEDCKQLQSDLDSVSSWCNRWQMKLNLLKCELLCIYNKRLPDTWGFT